MAIKHRIFALYHGDEFIGVGSFKELAELTGKPEDTIRWYSTAMHRKKVKDINKCWICFGIDEDETDSES